MMTISVIVGSTRQGRFSEKPAQWILQQLRKRDGIEARLLDLRDFRMPFFDQPMPPAMPGRHTNMMWLRSGLPTSLRRMVLYLSRRNTTTAPPLY